MPEQNEKMLLAAHGRWISGLRDHACLTDQRLSSLESRVSALEKQIMKLFKQKLELDIRISSMSDELAKLIPSSQPPVRGRRLKKAL